MSLELKRPTIKRIVFLCSGGGGNLRFIQRAVESGVLPELEIVGVIADRNCDALAFARNCGIRANQIAYAQSSPEQLNDLLNSLAPDIVITNIHKIIDAGTVKAWRGRMVNLHYSLLPAFKGLIGVEPVKRALDIGCRLIGTTAHLVEEEVDAGRIISQGATSTSALLPFNQVMDRIFRLGCITLANAIQITTVDQGFAGLNDSSAVFEHSLIAPAPRFAVDRLNEEFWASVRGVTATG